MKYVIVVITRQLLQHLTISFNSKKNSVDKLFLFLKFTRAPFGVWHCLVVKLYQDSSNMAPGSGEHGLLGINISQG